MGPNAMRRSSVTLPWGRGSVTEQRTPVGKWPRYFRNITLALASTGLWAQTLSIPPSLTARGSSGSLLLILDSPPGKAPAALQWQFTFPPNVSVDMPDIIAGSAAESGQKALTCRLVGDAKETGKSAVCACIVAGGQKAIPNGPIAIVRYRVPREIRQIPEKVRAGKVVGVTADLRSIEIPDAQGAIVLK
jgi:hypothetical protein